MMIYNKKLFLNSVFVVFQNLFAPPPFGNGELPNLQNANTTPMLLCTNPTTGEQFALFCIPILKSELDGFDGFYESESLPPPFDNFELIKAAGEVFQLTDENGQVTEEIICHAPPPPATEESSFELIETPLDPMLVKLNCLVAQTKYYFQRSLGGNLILIHQENGLIAELSPNFFLNKAFKTVIWGGKNLILFASNLFYGAIKTAEFGEFVSILLKAYIAKNI